MGTALNIPKYIIQKRMNWIKHMKGTRLGEEVCVYIVKNKCIIRKYV